MSHTVAQDKLHRLVAESSAVAVARKSGCLANTVRLLSLGSEPRAGTIRKLAVCGIAPQDWFTAAEGSLAPGAVVTIPSSTSGEARTIPLFPTPSITTRG